MPDVDNVADRVGRFRLFCAEAMVPQFNGQFNRAGEPVRYSEEERKDLAVIVIAGCKKGVHENAFLAIANLFAPWWHRHLKEVRTASGGRRKKKGACTRV